MNYNLLYLLVGLPSLVEERASSFSFHTEIMPIVFPTLSPSSTIPFSPHSSSLHYLPPCLPSAYFSSPQSPTPHLHFHLLHPPTFAFFSAPLFIHHHPLFFHPSFPLPPPRLQIEIMNSAIAEVPSSCTFCPI